LKLGIKEIGDSLKTKLAFDVIDKEAAALLGKQNLFWVGNFYNDQVKEKMTRTLHQYFEDGMTIEDAAAKLEVQFFDITDKGISYFESLAEHTTSRVREIGKVNGYVKAGIEYLQVKAIIDDRTSEICRRMNGTIIPVTDAMKLRDKILGASNPEQIKTIAPWRDPSDLPDVASDEGVPYSKVPGGMQFPPYHWNCRTITVAYFQ
jgi:SPP1 gp7 family putative phage head morphogenesis protein